jgi:hypothetical protein
MYVYVSKYHGHLCNMANICAQSGIRKQYFAAKPDSCISIIYIPTYSPFFLSLTTSRISLFCRYCVFRKIFMSVPNKARFSTNIKSCHCHKCVGCHVTLKRQIFHIKNSKAISHPKMYCQYFSYCLISCTFVASDVSLLLNQIKISQF